MHTPVSGKSFLPSLCKIPLCYKSMNTRGLKLMLGPSPALNLPTGLYWECGRGKSDLDSFYHPGNIAHCPAPQIPAGASRKVTVDVRFPPSVIAYR